MKQSTRSGVSDVESGASPSDNSIGAANRNPSERVTKDPSERVISFADSRATSSETPAPDGSIGYRIAALIAMVLLALATLVIWFYLRGN